MACTSQTLTGINGVCDRAMGGVKVAYLAPHADNTFTITDNAVSAVATPTAFKKYAFRKGNASFTSTLNVDDANGINYVTSELMMQFTRMETSKRIEINALALGGVMGVVIDANGTAYAIGVNEEVNATAGNGQTGQSKSDGNFYSITLTDDNPEFPPILTAQALESFLGSVEG